LKKTGSKQIDLVGHSAGGGFGRGYLIDTAHANKVAHYVHLGSRKWFTDMSWFPNSKCLNIFSAEDKIAGSGSGDVAGAANIDLKNKDHYEVATCEETFEAMFSFFNEGKKPVMKNVAGNISSIAGKSVLLGSNDVMVNAIIEVYDLTENADRKQASPRFIFKSDSTGKWGPFLADSKLYYEISLVPADVKARTISYFFEPFEISDHNIYLRGFPQGNMVAMMLGSVPGKEDQSAVVIYSANKAIIAGRDSVTINGVAISSPSLTPANKTLISSFIYDDGDGKTSGSSLKQYNAAPFIGGVDIFLPAGAGQSHEVYYNGKKLILPAVSSKEKVLLAVFR
jgi:hypothetical protein